MICKAVSRRNQDDIGECGVARKCSGQPDSIGMIARSNAIYTLRKIELVSVPELSAKDSWGIPRDRRMLR